MRGKNNLIVVSNFTKSKYEAPAAFRSENRSMTKCLSEYQSAFKTLPWQPVRQILKPNRNLTKDKVRAQMEKKSVYGIDYASYTKAPRKATPMKHKPELACPNVHMDTKTTYKLEYYTKAAEPQGITNPAAHPTKLTYQNQPFAGDSIYTASYPAYDQPTMSGSQQAPIKGKDNIEIPPTSQPDKNRKSTAQVDFIHHQNFERPSVMRPKENTQRPTDPLQSNTEYSDFYTDKMKDALYFSKQAFEKPAQKAYPEQKKFVAISTAMADFTRPEGFVRQKSCHPPPSNHFIPSPFDGTTTFSMAYKPWPVKRQEQPVWAKKPVYKRPLGGFLTNSLYMHDFRDPQMPLPPKPIRPNNNSKNLTDDKEGGDTKFTNLTTYNRDFKVWSNTAPPLSYHIVDVYQPPTEMMFCESNQRASFKGEPSTRVKPCKPVSQHRELNSDKGMTFVTTYSENYVNSRPLSSPSKSMPAAGVRARTNSAPSNCQAPPPSPKSTQSSCHPIPKPNLDLSQVETAVLTPSKVDPGDDKNCENSK